MKHSSFAVLLAALLAPLCATAGERLFVQVPAMIDPAAPIRQVIKAECGLDMLLGNHTLASLAKRSVEVQAVAGPEQAGADQVIQLTIISVHGHGGGSWSGPKSMSLRADLKQNGAILRTTVLSRSSSGGVFGGMKSTCSILDRVATALGKDVAKWVSSGSAGASGQADANAPEATEAPAPGASSQ